jgi:murein DD-endopeptidase MepM/ murein hydrolase activator NlpD
MLRLASQIRRCSTALIVAALGVSLAAPEVAAGPVVHATAKARARKPAVAARKLSAPASAQKPPAKTPASTRKPPAKSAASAKKPAAAQPALEPKLALSAREVNPGDPVLVTIDGGDDRPHGTGGKVPLVFFPVKRGWQAVFAVPLDDAPDTLTVSAAGQTATVKVRAKEFPLETATVEQDFAEPPADKRPIVDADNAAVIDALKNTSTPTWKGGFRRPGPGRPTSPFGVWRSFNGDLHKSRHLGLDLAAKKGAPVRAVQAGKVTLVRDGFLMGGIVVIAHGAGIASAYFHLSDPTVAIGDEIAAGKVIGKVSLTGRTTGPHIHLGLWVPGGFVNPAVFEKLKLRPIRPMPAGQD